jgi:hypothetical protein
VDSKSPGQDDAGGRILSYGRKSSTRWRRRAGVFAVLVAIGIGTRFHTRHPSQGMGEFAAVWDLNIWSVYGFEVFAADRLRIVPSSQISPNSNDVRWFVRLFGWRLPGSADERGLDAPFVERDHDLRKVFAYIVKAKLGSEDPQERIWAVRTLWTPERYPGQGQDVLKLLNDPNASVREAARKRLTKCGWLLGPEH